MSGRSVGQRREKIALLPDPLGSVETRWCFPRFRAWTGEPITDTYNGKAVLELAGKPLFAELVILRLLEREGWQGCG